MSTYLPALYVPEPGEAVGAPAVRALPPADGLKSYAAPNYVTGVAGALLSLVSTICLLAFPSSCLSSPHSLPLPSFLSPSLQSSFLSISLVISVSHDL